jgi:uncharacterized protein
MFISDTDRLKIVEWAGNHPAIKRVYLYGSRARGDHHADSDIDLGIQIEAPDKDEAYSIWFWWREDYQKAPDLHLEHMVDLQWYEPNAGLQRVGPGVEKDGILIFER